MEDNKQFYVQIPGTDQGQVWDSAKFERNKEKLYNQYPDVNVQEVSGYDPSTDPVAGTTYRVTIPGEAEAQDWDSDKLARNREKLYSLYPNVKVEAYSPYMNPNAPMTADQTAAMSANAANIAAMGDIYQGRFSGISAPSTQQILGRFNSKAEDRTRNEWNYAASLNPEESAAYEEERQAIIDHNAAARQANGNALRENYIDKQITAWENRRKTAPKSDIPAIESALDRLYNEKDSLSKQDFDKANEVLKDAADLGDTIQADTATLSQLTERYSGSRNPADYTSEQAKEDISQLSSLSETIMKNKADLLNVSANLSQEDYDQGINAVKAFTRRADALRSRIKSATDPKKKDELKEELAKVEGRSRSLETVLYNSPIHRQAIANLNNSISKAKEDLDAAQEEQISTTDAFNKGELGDAIIQAYDPSVDGNNYQAARYYLDEAKRMANRNIKYVDDTNKFKKAGGFLKEMGTQVIGNVDAGEAIFRPAESYIESYVPFIKSLKAQNNDMVRDVFEKIVDQGGEIGGDISGVALTPSEKALYDSYMTMVATTTARANDTAAGVQGGQIAGQSLNYAAEFAATLNLREGVRQAVENGMEKYLRLGASKLLAKGTPAAVVHTARLAAIPATQVASKLAQTAAMLPFVNSTQDTISENLLQVQDDGTLMSKGKGTGLGILQTAKELYTEMLGESIMAGIQQAGRIMDPAVSRTGASFKNLYDKYLKSNISEYSKEGALAYHQGKFAAATMFDGFFMEPLEEVQGAAIDAIAFGNKDAWSEFWKPENLKEMMAGFIPMSVFGLPFGMAGVAAEYKANNDLSAAEQNLKNAMPRQGWFDEEWKNFFTEMRSKVGSLDAIRSRMKDFQERYQAELEADAAAGRMQPEDVAEKMKVLTSYTNQLINHYAVQGAKQAYYDQIRDQKIAELQAPMGDTSFYFEDAEGNRTVTTANINGNQVYVTSPYTEGTAGKVAVVYPDGRKSIVDVNALADINTQDLNSYADALVGNDIRNQQKQRMDSEYQNAKAEILKQINGGATLSFGVDGAKKEGKPISIRPDGIIVEFAEDTTINGETKKIHKISFEQAGKALPTPVDLVEKTDEQLAKEIAAKQDERTKKKNALNKKFRRKDFMYNGRRFSFDRIYESPMVDQQGNEWVSVVAVDEFGQKREVTMPYKDLAEQDAIGRNDMPAFSVEPDANATAVAAGEASINEGPKDFRGNPLPMTTNRFGQQVVDENTLWNNDPEAWCKYNDQNPSQAEPSAAYLQKAINNLLAQRDAINAKIAAELDHAAIADLVDQRNEIEQRATVLNNLLTGYIDQAAQQAGMEATQLNQIRAKINDMINAVDDERVNAYQERLNGAADITEREAVITEYLSGIASTEFIIATKDNYLSKLENIVDESSLFSVQTAFAAGKTPGAFYDPKSKKIVIFADSVYSIDDLRRTYIHERQHGLSKNTPEGRKLKVEIVKAYQGRLEELKDKVQALCLSDFYRNRVQGDAAQFEENAEELISYTMELAYSLEPEQFREALEWYGIDTNVINLLTDTDNGQRTDSSLSQARRGRARVLYGDETGAGDNRENETAQGEEPGAVGTQGRGADGGSNQSAESGGSGGIDLRILPDETTVAEPAPGTDGGIISEQTAQELAAKNLVMDGGAVMDTEHKALKDETGYLTPNEREAELDDVRFSITTLDAWRKNYRQLPDSEERIVRALTNWAERAAADELVSGVISQGEYEYMGKKKVDSGTFAGPIRTNVEYIVTFDMDTTCPRTFQYLNYSREIERRIGRPLSQTECIQLIEMMRAYGQQIPCVYCYAENKRQALKQYYTNFIEARHAVLREDDEAKALQAMYGHDGDWDTTGSLDPDVVLTKPAAKVYKEWRKNRKSMYNPTMKQLWFQYNSTRDSILTDLDNMLADGRIGTKMKDSAIAKIVAEDLHITDKEALKVVADIVSEWKWDAIEGKEHQGFTPMEEDDIFAHENALTLWREMTAYAKSASSAKSVLRYIPYTDELKYISEEDRNFINGMGGLRMHSSNDFRIDYVLDYFQFMADMAANKMYGHTYTKSPEFVRIFGNSGYKINMSIAAYQDANGNIRMNEDEGFNWDVAKELRQLFPNAGTMLKATSDEQIQMALDSDWIDMFIPFHASSLPEAIWKDMRSWSDYTARQNERFFNSDDIKAALTEAGIPFNKKMPAKDLEQLFFDQMGIKRIYKKSGKDAGKRIRPHFLPGPTIVEGELVPGHNNDIATYFELCRQYGVHPRFEGIQVKDAQGNTIDITQHPGYIKCIKETARTDSPQTAIQFNFDQPSEALGGKSPLEYALETLQNMAAAEQSMAGKAVQDIYESTKQDPYGIVPQFIDIIVKHKDETGEDYPVDFLTPDAREWFLTERRALQEAYSDVAEVPYHPTEYDLQGQPVQRELTDAQRNMLNFIGETPAEEQANFRVAAQDQINAGQKKAGVTYVPEADLQADLVSFRTVYHGSGAIFDKFDTKFMSTGEGNQAYGWGTYVTDNEETGRKYAEIARFGAPIRYTGDNISMIPSNLLDDAKGEIAKHGSYSAAKAYFDNGSWEPASYGDMMQKVFDRTGEDDWDVPSRQLYTVEIPDDNGENYLHWDQPITRSQSKKIIDGIKALIGDRLLEEFGDAKSVDYELKSALGYGTEGSRVEGALDYFFGNETNYATGENPGAERNSKFLNSLGIVGMQVPIDRNGGQRYKGSNYVIYNTDDAQITNRVNFRISNNNRDVMTKWFGKWLDAHEGQLLDMETGLTADATEKDANIQSLLQFVDETFQDPTEQLAWAKWFTRGTVMIGEEDVPKVKQAVKVAKNHKADPLQFSSPMEIIEQWPEKIKDAAIDPDTVSTLHRAQEVPGTGIVIYNVDDTMESRENMRQIINTHFGKKTSPWCLLQGDENGKLTSESQRYWDHYNAYPKQVAFKDGKLLAFSANDSSQVKWWDRQDASHDGVPVIGDIPNDELGRSATMEYDPATGEVIRIGNVHKGNKQNGEYTEWYQPTGEIIERSNWKNGVQHGVTEFYSTSGILSSRAHFNDGKLDGAYEHYYASDGALQSIETYRNGEMLTQKQYYHSGQLSLEYETTYPGDGPVKSTRTVYDKNGNVTDRHIVDDSIGFVGSEGFMRDGTRTYVETSDGIMTFTRYTFGDMPYYIDAISLADRRRTSYRATNEALEDLIDQADAKYTDALDRQEFLVADDWRNKRSHLITTSNNRGATVVPGYTERKVESLEEAYEKAKRNNVSFRTVEIAPEVRAEMDEIKAAAQADGTFMKAPNGKDTNLDEENWLMVRTGNFKNWFGDWINDPTNASKVVDENGEPMIQYHGARNDSDFTVFDTYQALQDNDLGNVGSHFGPKETAMEFGGEDTMYSVFLNIRKPLETFDFFADLYNNAYLEVLNDLRNKAENEETKEIFERVYDIYPQLLDVDLNDISFSEYFDEDDGLEEPWHSGMSDRDLDRIGRDHSEHRNELVRILYDMMAFEGYDGLTYENWYEGPQQMCWVALEPSQIKSATDNTGEFSSENPDIRFRASQAPLQDMNDLRSELQAKYDGAGQEAWSEEDRQRWADAVNSWINQPRESEVRFSISEGNRAEYIAKITDWLSPENKQMILDELAKRDTSNMSKDDIRKLKREITFSLFPNDSESIGAIDADYLPYFEDSNIVDNTIYSGKAYFIDHSFFSHPEITVDDYKKMLDTMSDPDVVKLDTRHEGRALLFIKKYSKYFAEVVKSDADSKLVLHKTFYYKDKVPQKGLPNVEPVRKVSEGGSASIDPAEAVTSTRLSVFDTIDKDTNNSENPNTRFRFIGEKGARRLDTIVERTPAGEVKITVNGELTNNLQLANKMEKEGKDAKAIKVATGWERGADGKWRYEQPDIHFTKPEDTFWYMNEPKPLGSFVSDPTLFQAYPELKDLNVYVKSLKSDTLGVVDSEGNIVLNSKYMSKVGVRYTIRASDVYETLLHELQHKIQAIEGFARGDSGVMTTSKLREQFSGDEVTFSFAELFGANTKSNMLANNPENLASLLRRAGEQSDKNMQYYIDTLLPVLNGMPASEYKDMVNKAYQTIRKTRTLVNVNYKKSAGEAEARNVERRRSMTPEERRNSLASETADIPFEDQIVRFSIRTKPAPEKTGIGYKVFYLKDGKLYPPMVANPNGEATPVGVWLDADAAPIAGTSKTGRPQVKAGGKGTQGGSGQLAYRPGWHLGTIPYAIQFNRKDENGEKTLFPKDFVWAEVEYAADNNYQQEAEAEGINPSGKFQHSLAGLKRLPEDGYYMYRTNPNPETDPWIITGAMKVNKILTRAEVDALVREAGREPQRVEGDTTPVESFNSRPAVEIPEGRAGNVMMRVFNQVPEAARRAIVEDAMDTDLNFANATARHYGELAMKSELTEDEKNEVRAAADVMASELGLDGMTNNEAIMAMWDAGNRDGSVLAEMRRSIAQRNLGLTPAEQEAVRDVDTQIRFRNAMHEFTGSAANFYNRNVNYFWNMMDEAYVDMNVSVNKLVEAIEKATGMKAEGWEDIRLALNQLSSKNLADKETYMAKYYEPLMQAVYDVMNQTGKSYEDVERYMMLKHGLERNDVFAKRDAIEYYKKKRDEHIASIKENVAKALQAKIDQIKADFPTDEWDIEIQAAKDAAKIDREAKIRDANNFFENRKKDIENSKYERSADWDLEAAEAAYEASKKAIAERKDAGKITAEVASEAYEQNLKNFKKAKRDIEKRYGINIHYLENRRNDYSGLMAWYVDEATIPEKLDTESEEEYRTRAAEATKQIYDKLADAEEQATTDVERFERDAYVFPDEVNSFNKRSKSTKLTGETDLAKVLWEKINAATEENLRIGYDKGLIAKPEYDHVRNMFQYYVPLMGFKDDTAADVYHYTDKNVKTAFSQVIRHAKGRRTIADSPLGWIGNKAESVIQEGNKNEAKKTLYYFLQNRPDQDIVTIDQQWYERGTDKDGNEIWNPIYPKLDKGMSGDEVAQALADFKDYLNTHSKDVIRKDNKLALDKGLVFVQPQAASEHEIRIKVNGDEIVMYINGNPRAAQAINGMLNSDRTRSASFIKGSVLRWLASVSTSFNPEFWISNFERDFIFSRVKMDTQGDKLMKEAYNQNYGEVFRSTLKLMKAYKDGTLGDSRMETYYKEYADNGGITGYTVLANHDEFEEMMKDFIKSQREGKGKTAAKKVMESIKDFSEAIEQINRFAGFVAARESGKDIETSVSWAKEITANFNRKGSAVEFTMDDIANMTTRNGRKLNKTEQRLAYMALNAAGLGRSSYLFFNAAIQGLKNHVDIIKANPAGAAKWATILIVTGALNALIHAALDDPDDDNNYAGISDYTRRTNLLLGGKGYYIKWAIPQEERVFYAMGDIIANKFLGKSPDENAVMEVVDLFTELLPLGTAAGGDLLGTLLPAQLAPIYEAAVNKNFTGSKLTLDYPGMDKKAAYKSAMRSTRPVFIKISKAINEIGKEGDYEEIGWVEQSDLGRAVNNPAFVQHIIEGYTGGVGKTVTKFLDTFTGVHNMIKDLKAGDSFDKAWQEMPKASEAPFIGRVFVNTNRNASSYVSNVFNYYNDIAERAKNSQKNAKEALEEAEAAYKKAHAADTKMRTMGDEAFDPEIAKAGEEAHEAYKKAKADMKQFNKSEGKRIMDAMDKLKKSDAYKSLDKKIKNEPDGPERERLLQEMSQLKLQVVLELSKPKNKNNR